MNYLECLELDLKDEEDRVARAEDQKLGATTIDYHKAEAEVIRSAIAKETAPRWPKHEDCDCDRCDPDPLAYVEGWVER